MKVFVIRVTIVMVAITTIRCKSVTRILQEISDGSYLSRDHLYIKVKKPGNITRKACTPCPAGHEPSIPCGSTVDIKVFRELYTSCSPCPRGTISTRRSTLPCTQCSRCNNGDHVFRNCTPWYDTICHSCPSDYYLDEDHSSCLPCSRCCGDSKDVRIGVCTRQGSQHHCSYHSHRRCHGDGRNNTNPNKVKFERVVKTYPTELFLTERIPSDVPIATTNWTSHSETHIANLLRGKKNTLLILTVALVFFFLITIICFIIILRFSLTKNRKMYSCFPVRLSKEKGQSEACQSDRLSDDLEDWAKQDSKSGRYSFKCGVLLHPDTTSRLDANKDLIVEVLDGPLHSYLNKLQSNLMFLSPIFKFYSQGTQFEKPVEVCLPHSALIKSSSQLWDIEVLCVDGREGKEGKWRKVKSEINVKWNEVTFKTNTLLTYAVVGKPRENAKKRMQLAVFAMRRMLSDHFAMLLYLFDDNEYSLQRIIKANNSKGWSMVGSLYAVFVDCHNPINMGIQVEDLQEPWSLVHLEREARNTSQMLRDSYFNIPQYRAVFRRSKRNAKKLTCNLRVDIGGKETIIPVVVFVPEEMMCVFVEVHNEDPSIYDNKTLVRDLPYDVNYELCRKLDVPAKGRGQWRQLGRLLGLPEDSIEECSREYATLDGSPSKALMELICNTKPKTTVGELAKCLNELHRCDALSALKSLKK